MKNLITDENEREIAYNEETTEKCKADDYLSKGAGDSVDDSGDC